MTNRHRQRLYIPKDAKIRILPGYETLTDWATFHFKRTPDNNYVRTEGPNTIDMVQGSDGTYERKPAG